MLRPGKGVVVKETLETDAAALQPDTIDEQRRTDTHEPTVSSGADMGKAMSDNGERSATDDQPPRPGTVSGGEDSHTNNNKPASGMQHVKGILSELQESNSSRPRSRRAKDEQSQHTVIQELQQEYSERAFYLNFIVIMKHMYMEAIRQFFMNKVNMGMLVVIIPVALGMPLGVTSFFLSTVFSYLFFGLVYLFYRVYKLYGEYVNSQDDLGDCSDALMEHWQGERQRFWVATFNGTVVGTIAVKETSQVTAEIARFLVHPTFRRCGIGGRLLRTALDFSKEKDYKNAVIATHSLMCDANTLCRRHGFILSETTEEKYVIPLVLPTHLNIFTINLSEEQN